MPGPLGLPTTISLPNLVPDLAAIWRQNRHPVYNALGRQVGSYDTLDALCGGNWFLLAGETKPPPSQLYVLDFWGRKVPLASRCVAAAKATAAGGVRAAITQPQKVQPASAARAVADANQAATGSPAPIDLNALVAPGGGAGLDLNDPATRVQLGTYAIWGTAALLGLSLILGGGDGRRRR